MHNSFFTKLFSALMIVTLALGAIPIKPVYAAAAQLNPWTLAASTGASGNNGTIAAGNLTVSAGANRLFLAAVCLELSGANDFTALNISLGGVALTEIDSTENGTFQEHCYMGYLLNSQIPAGSNALTVPYNIAGNTTTIQGAHVYWASYSGINQANPINDSNANSNNAANVSFGQQIDYLLDGVTFYVSGNLGSPATMTAPATFTQQLATTSNGHSSFIGRITTVPHAAAGNYGGGTNVTFGGTTGARSSLVVASLRPLIAATTTGTATATAASSSSINVSMPYTFDEDADNTYTIQYCLTSANCSVSGSWINFVTGAAHTASPYTNTITGLAASTSYDVRVTYIDADGVNGTNPQIISNVLTLPPPSEIDVQGNGISISDGDGTPSATDFTDFGNVPENFSVDRTFTILNTGAGNLTLGAITFVGGNNGDFSVVTPPTSPVLPGGSTTFTVRLTAGGGGGATRDTTIMIVNNDPNEAPYNFDIQGTRINAEINVQSLGNNITSTILQLPSLANCTRFPDTGLTGYSDCTYTIQNLSPATVLQVGTVTFTGGATGDFSVITPPAATVPGGGSTTFTVRFTPTVTGLRATILSFINNDSNESPYIFPIAGLATANTPPTTSGITNVNVLEDAPDTVFSLYPSFADTQSTDAQLIYTVTGNTNPGLFTSVSIADPTNFTLDYAPNVNGTANITVRATDTGGLFVEDTFQVTVTAVNDEPDFTAADPAAVIEDAGAQSVVGWVTAVDFGPADEDVSQTVSQYIISNSSCGTLLSTGPAVSAAGDLTFTPNTDQNGTCTFDVQVQDDGGVLNGGDDTSPIHNFTITVNAVNDEPDFTAANPATVIEDSGAQSVPGWVTAVDFGPADEDLSQAVSQYIISNSTCGTLLSTGPVVSVTGDLTYTPATDQNGTCAFDVQVQDDGGVLNGGDDTSPIHNFTITVTAVNDEPDFTAVNPVAVNEDAGAQTVVGWVTAVDFGPIDEDLSQAVSQYIISNSTCGTLLSADPAVNNAGDLTFTPAADQNGTCTFDVQVQDDGGVANGGDDTSPIHNFTITVSIVNDEPDFTAANPAAVIEDSGAQSVAGWVTAVDFGPADEDLSQAVSQYIISNNTCGTLLSAGPAVSIIGTLTYTPAADQNGTCTFDVQVQDDGGILNGGDDTSPAHNFTITVTAVNDEPDFTAANPATVNEDAGAQSVVGWVTAVDFGPADEDLSQAVSQYIISNSTCGTLLSSAPAVSSTGTLTYTPAADQNGTCTFDVQVQDDGGVLNGGDDTSPIHNFTITVNAVNDEPDFTAANPAAVNEDAGAQSVVGWVTAVDFGPADEDLSQAVLQYIISNNTCGTLLSASPAVNVTGDLTYTPAVDQNGTCTFDVQVQDNGGVALGGDDTSPAHTFTITVSAVNEEPDFTATDPAAVNEDAGAQSVAGWVTAVDFGPPDEDISQSVLGYIISNSTCGTLLSTGPAVSVTGTLTYTPAADANGTCTFDAQVQDDGGVALGGDDTGPIHNFTITVIAINDEPIFNANNPSPVNEDAGAQSILVWATADLGPADEDLSQAIAQYMVSGSTCGTLLSAGPAVSVAGTLTYTPAANANGTCTFDVAVQDNGGVANGGDDTSPTQNFTITVNAVNDEPSYTASNPAAVNEDAGAQSVAGWVTSVNLGPANEAAQAVLGYIISNNASCASLLSAGPSVDVAGTLTYTPSTDANGTCTFDAAVQDDGGTANGGDDTSPTQNFTITVNAVNDEPSFTASNPPAVYEDSAAQSISGWATPSFGPANESGQAVSQYIVSNNTCTTLLSTGPAVSNAGTLTYTPAPDQNGTCNFDVQVQDNGGTANGGDDTSPTQNFTITVTAQTIITASITADDKVYDGNNTATFTCSLTGVVPPDVVNCTGGTATFNDKNVDVNKLVTAIGLGLSGADAFKYQLSVTTATDMADITQRTLVVTATGIDKVYDGNTNATVTLADDRVGGDVFTVNYTTATFVDPNVNVNIPINVSGISIGAGADAGNYTLNGVTTASTDADITIAGQTITVTTSAPIAAVNGSSFNVAATASSGLPVTISVSGVCTVADLDGSVTDGDATVTMTSGTGTCSVFYDQAGDTNFTLAPQVREDVTATDSPVITSADHASFDLGFAGNFNITATGNPSIMIISVTGTLPTGISFTDNGDGTASFSGTPAAGTAGVYPLVLTANNGVNPNGTQNFTLTVRNGPIASNVNSLPDTGDESVTENESVATTLGITQLTVEFSQDVYDVPASTTDTDEVDNPANYILVRSATGVFNTLSCSGGVVAPDIINPVTAVTYSNGGGSGPFVATLTLTTPLTTAGYYRLFVCGTTSIVDAVNTGLILAGDGTTPGTDFTRNFVLTVPAAGGGGGGGRRDDAKLAVAALPATGFAPGRITKLPIQPDELAYSDLGEMWIEIPSLGIKTSIIGVPQTTEGEWDVTWLANNVGWLNGTAFPTWEGNSVVTAHVTNADGLDGPFANLKKLKYGDQIIIHLYGQKYTFEVRNSRLTRPFTTSFAFEDLEDASYLTLITCQTYLPKSDTYMHRRVIRAVLVSVQDE